MKPVDVNLNAYIDFNNENNKNGRKFEFGVNASISKHEIIFAKVVKLQIGLKKVLLLKKSKNLFRMDVC